MPKTIKLSATNSTNTVCKELASEGASEGALVLAQCQTGGRGRLTRSFFSYKGGLYMSLLLRPKFSAESAGLITAAAAVAAAEILEELSGRKCEIKWVNDIYIGEKKVCGILTEGAVNPQTGGFEYAVLGVGANLCAPKGGFPEEIRDTADFVFENALSFDEICEIAQKISDRFFTFYGELEGRKFLEGYRRRSFLLGKTVQFEKDGRLHTARASGVDDNAGLITEENGSQSILRAGEVSVKWE